MADVDDFEEQAEDADEEENKKLISNLTDAFKQTAGSTASQNAAIKQATEILKKFPEFIPALQTALLGTNDEISKLRAYLTHDNFAWHGQADEDNESVRLLREINQKLAQQTEFQKKNDKREEERDQTAKKEKIKQNGQKAKEEAQKKKSPNKKEDNKQSAEEEKEPPKQTRPRQQSAPSTGSSSTSRYHKPNYKKQGGLRADGKSSYHSGKVTVEHIPQPKNDDSWEKEAKAEEPDSKLNQQREQTKTAEQSAPKEAPKQQNAPKETPKPQTAPKSNTKQQTRPKKNEQQSWQDGLKQYAQQQGISEETAREQLKDYIRDHGANPQTTITQEDVERRAEERKWEYHYRKEHPQPKNEPLYKMAGLNSNATIENSMGQLYRGAATSGKLPTYGDLERTYYADNKIPAALEKNLKERFGQNILNQRIAPDTYYGETDVAGFARLYRRNLLNKARGEQAENKRQWQEAHDKAKSEKFAAENVQINTSNVKVSSPVPPEGEKKKEETPKSAPKQQEKAEKQTKTPPTQSAEQSMRDFLGAQNKNNANASANPADFIYAEAGKNISDEEDAKNRERIKNGQKANREKRAYAQEQIAEERDVQSKLRQMRIDKDQEKIDNAPVQEAKDRADEEKAKLFYGHRSRGGGFVDSLMYGLSWRAGRLLEYRAGLKGSFTKDMLADALNGAILRRIFGYKKTTYAKPVTDENGNFVKDENGNQQFEEAEQLSSVEKPTKWQERLRKLFGIKNPNASPQEQEMEHDNAMYNVWHALNKFKMVATPVIIGAALAGGATAWFRDIRNRTLNNGTSYAGATENTIQDALFDGLHLFGFAANSGKDIREDRQTALENNWTLFGGRANTYVSTSMWARSMGLTTQADQEWIREQTAMGASAEQIRQSFLNLKNESQKLGVSFKTLSQMTAEQVTEADKLIGNGSNQQIVKASGKFDALLNANGFTSSAAQDIANMSSFKQMEVQALAASGHAKAASYAGSNASALLTQAEKYGVISQAFQQWKKTWYHASSDNEEAYSTNLTNAGITSKDIKSSLATSFNNTKQGLTAQQEIHQTLTIQLQDGLSGQIQNQNLYQQGLHDVTGTGKYFAMDNFAIERENQQ